MKIELKLESGLEVDFTPEFRLPNQSLIGQVKWMLPNLQVELYETEEVKKEEPKTKKK